MMSDKEFNPIKRFWIADIIVLVCFLSTAIFGLYLFRADLLQTLENRDMPPIGIIVIRNNIVQRRYEDRVIWERMFVNSPVYSGDFIRAADLSSATIYVDDIQIGLSENTLIRLQHSSDDRASFEVELRGGNVSVAAGSAYGERAEKAGAVLVNLMGRQVHVESGTTLNAELGEEGIVVKVSEGKAVFIEDGQERQIDEGMMIAQDTAGNERSIPAAVVTSFGPNARFLKSTRELLPIDFVWKSINIEDGKTVRLEIASDRNFTKDFRVIGGFENNARALLNSGVWYWRLSLDGASLNTGQLTVADASGPELLSPVRDSVYRYFSALPQIRFQWSQRSGASHYIVEISGTPDFVNPQISRQTASSSFIQSGLETGTWYWRVLPVFPDAYKGSANYSAAGVFKIEKTDISQTPAIEIPEAALIPKAGTESLGTVPRTEVPRIEVPGAIISETSVPGAIISETKIPGTTILYIVRPGDTLGRISGRFYGDPYRWPEISEYNKLKNPDLIFVDQQLFIP